MRKNLTSVSCPSARAGPLGSGALCCPTPGRDFKQFRAKACCWSIHQKPNICAHCDLVAVVEASSPVSCAEAVRSCPEIGNCQTGKAWQARQDSSKARCRRVLTDIPHFTLTTEAATIIWGVLTGQSDGWWEILSSNQHRGPEGERQRPKDEILPRIREGISQWNKSLLLANIPSSPPLLPTPPQANWSLFSGRKKNNLYVCEDKIAKLGNARASHLNQHHWLRHWLTDWGSCYEIYHI